MKIVLFGASGLIGQGVLRECLAAADVERVVSIARAPLGVTHELDSDAPRSTGACFLTVHATFQGPCTRSIGALKMPSEPSGPNAQRSESPT